VEGPYIQVADTGAIVPLRPEVTTVGRGSHVDVRLDDPSVSLLHAEIVRRGPYVYVSDLGLSRNGTRVNGRLVARRVLTDGDALTFGSARCRIGGITTDDVREAELPRSAAPELTRRELDVITSLCRPALSDDAFVAPATAREIAADLVVTEAAVKQHLLRLYTKLRIPEGVNRRIRLANEVVALGLARPQLPEDQRGQASQGGTGGTGGTGMSRPGPGTARQLAPANNARDRGGQPDGIKAGVMRGGAPPQKQAADGTRPARSADDMAGRQGAGDQRAGKPPPLRARIGGPA
jgi:FHA domain